MQPDCCGCPWATSYQAWWGELVGHSVQRSCLVSQALHHAIFDLQGYASAGLVKTVRGFAEMSELQAERFTE